MSGPLNPETDKHPYTGKKKITYFEENGKFDYPKSVPESLKGDTFHPIKTLVGGTESWRANNPGNIQAGVKWLYGRTNKNGKKEYEYGPTKFHGRPTATLKGGWSLEKNPHTGSPIGRLATGVKSQNTGIGFDIYFAYGEQFQDVIYPTYQTGVQAAVTVLEGRQYSGGTYTKNHKTITEPSKTISQALREWVTGNPDHDLTAELKSYIATALKGLNDTLPKGSPKFTASSLLNTLTPAQLATFVEKGIQVAEGWKNHNYPRIEEGTLTPKGWKIQLNPGDAALLTNYAASSFVTSGTGSLSTPAADLSPSITPTGVASPLHHST